ncbi:MAG: DUF4262 domain-containing protein [Actinomycetota bacterium]|nr:DUF4262 domain-containing protein [Actinomycetota bacterium]
MCAMCDRPDLTPEDVLADVRARISQDLFATVSVQGSRCTAELSYTVGLTEHGLPELVVTGQRAETATRLVRLWAGYLLDENVVLAGEVLRSGPWLMEAVPVTRPRQHLLVADRFYGDRLRALQLVWADGRGRWPWEPGHRARSAGQPVLGDRAPHYCQDHAPRLDVPRHP